MSGGLYRFPYEKDASWNSYTRQKQRYEIIRPFLGESGSVGAEIGVYKGGFGEFLLPHCKKLYLVDPWYRLRPYWGEPIEANSAASALIFILQVYLQEINAGRVVVVPDFGISFLRSMETDSLDWIYLDASHSYESTREEISEASRVVRTGGVICGDDYDPNPASHSHGVYLAVNEFCAKYNKVLIINESRQWGFIV